MFIHPNMLRLQDQIRPMPQDTNAGKSRGRVTGIHWDNTRGMLIELDNITAYRPQSQFLDIVWTAWDDCVLINSLDDIRRGIYVVIHTPNDDIVHGKIKDISHAQHIQDYTFVTIAQIGDGKLILGQEVLNHIYATDSVNEYESWRHQFESANRGRR